jgi:hypothetical protein
MITLKGRRQFRGAAYRTISVAHFQPMYAWNLEEEKEALNGDSLGPVLCFFPSRRSSKDPSPMRI